MLDGIKNVLRKVGVKLGLIKKLENIAEHSKVAVSDDFYGEIIKWRELHKGYHASIHDYTIHTIAGTSTGVRKTMNMPKMVTQELATLIFNERCNISISDEKYNKFIEDVFKDNGFNGNFQQHLEFMFAQGGMVMKPYVANGKVKLSYVTADCFLPISWTNTTIEEGVFVSEIKHDGKKYTHLEWHEVKEGERVITNELYESAGSSLGSKVPLSTVYPHVEPVVTFSNVKRPLFSYFKPNLANNIDSTIPLGISVYANSMSALESLDTSYDSLDREIRLGRKRISVPVAATKPIIDSETGKATRYFDTKDEVYEAFDTDMDAKEIKEFNSSLRVNEIVQAINTHLSVLSTQLGFDSGTFSFDGKSMKTATEVVSENSKTFRTKQSHENVIEQGITDLIECIGLVAEIHGLYTPPKEYDVTVTFDDSIAQDRTTDINEQLLLIAGGLQSKLSAIMKIHGLTDEEAQIKLDEIKKEELASVPSLKEVEKEGALFGDKE